jgi:Ca2+-binding EF-hand superfamily protein
MKTTHLIPLLVAALSGLAPLPATAHAGHIVELEKRFAAADKDHDGKLTLEEARAAGMSSVVRDFDRIDKDRKGFVTLDQLKTRLLSKDH